MLETEHARWAAALERVRGIEHQSPSLRKRRRKKPFSYLGRSAWASVSGHRALPSNSRHDQSEPGLIKERVSAESALIGKFDVDSEVRLRAFYPSKNLTLRYQKGGHRNGVDRTVQAYKAVHAHAPTLMPKIYDYGSILNGDGVYLVEDIVIGEPATGTEMQTLVTPLLNRLTEVYRGAGVDYKPLSKVVNKYFKKRWKNFVQDYGVDVRLDESVKDLVRRDDRLAISVSHGDLVRSNILVAGNDYVLVDWEFAGFQPIAFDLSKILLTVPDETLAIENILNIVNTFAQQGKGNYSFTEQLALAHIQRMTWYDKHSAKAANAGRLDIYHRHTKARLKSVENLLGID